MTEFVGKLIGKLLFISFTIVYLCTFIKSMLQKKILFNQGKGTKLSENKIRFLYYICYHGLFVLVFGSITIYGCFFYNQ